MCVIDYCCWVLLGLDWVTPMMLFNSHVTCSCIFHAYVLFLYTLNKCFFLFFLSFSLSLFLSRIDCVVAPKQRKSIPTWNPLQGFGSSSSIPSHIWFCDEKAKTNFFENFQDSGVHSERQVILLDFFDITLPDVIWTRGGNPYVRNLCVVLCASVCYVIPRYTYSSYPGSCCWGTTSP